MAKLPFLDEPEGERAPGPLRVIDADVVYEEAARTAILQENAAQVFRGEPCAG